MQRGFSLNEICDIDKKSFNYTQKEDGKYIKYYNGIAIIYTSNQQEIVSVVSRPEASENWNEI